MTTNSKNILRPLDANSSISTLILDSEDKDLDTKDIKEEIVKLVAKKSNSCSSPEFDSTIIQRPFNSPVIKEEKDKASFARIISSKSLPIRVNADTVNVSSQLTSTESRVKFIDSDNLENLVIDNSLKLKRLNLPTPLNPKISQLITRKRSNESLKRVPFKALAESTLLAHKVSSLKRTGSPLKNEINTKQSKLSPNLTFLAWIKHNEELMNKLKFLQMNLISRRYILLDNLEQLGNRLENYIMSLDELDHDSVNQFEKLQAKAEKVFEKFK